MPSRLTLKFFLVFSYVLFGLGVFLATTHFLKEDWFFFAWDIVLVCGLNLYNIRNLTRLLQRY